MKVLIPELLLILICLNQLTLGVLYSHPSSDFGSYQFTFTGVGPNYLNASSANNTYIFTCSIPDVFPSIYSTALALNGYKMGNSNSMEFLLTHTTTLSNFTATIRVYGSTSFYSLTYCFLLITNNGYSYMDLVSQKFNFNILNTGSAVTRKQNITLNVRYGQNCQIVYYLTSFRIVGSPSTLCQLNPLRLYNQRISTTPILEFGAGSAQVSEVVLSYFFIYVLRVSKPIIFQSRSYQITEIGSSTAFDIPRNYGISNYLTNENSLDRYCSGGLYGIAIFPSPGIELFLNFKNGTISQRNQSYSMVNFRNFITVNCMADATCQALEYYQYNQKCLPCGPFLHCSACKIVQNECQSCQNNFILNTTTKLCQCPPNLMEMNDVCINVYGCISGAKVLGVPVCIFCNLSLNLILSADVCVCKNGYSMIGNQCILNCGDALMISTEECDDGNNKCGDGCCQCLIEDGYQCTTALASKSICLPKMVSYLRLNYIQKMMDSNSAIFEFQYSSASNLQLQAVITSVLFNINTHITSSYSCSGNKLTILVTFNADIQSQTGYIVVKMNQNNIISPDIKLTFSARGFNAPLIISQSNHSKVTIQILCYLVVGTAAAVFVLSALYQQKFIGAETMIPIQIIYFLLTYNQLRIMPFYYLQSLLYANGYNGFFYQKLNNFKLESIKKYLLFDIQFFANFNFFLFFYFISIVALLMILICKRRFYIKFQRKQFKNKYKQIKTLRRKIFDLIMVPMVLISTLQLFESFVIHRGDDQPDSIIINKINQLLMFFSITFYCAVYCSHILFSISKLIPFDSSSYTRLYPSTLSFYIIFASVFIIFVPNSLNLLIGFGVYQSAYILYLFILRPYQYFFNNFIIILSSLIVLAHIITLILVQYISVDQQIIVYYCYALTGTLILLNLLSLLRIILEKRYQRLKQFDLLKENKLRKQKNNQADLLAMNKMNPYRVVTQQIIKQEKEIKKVNQLRSNLDLQNITMNYKNIQRQFNKKQSNIKKSNNEQLLKRQANEDENTNEKKEQQHESPQFIAIKAKIKNSFIQRLKKEK